MENTFKTNGATTKKSFITDTLVKGMLVLLPITIIFIVLSVIFNFIFEILAPMSSLLHPGPDARWVFNLISLIILIIFAFLVGVAIKNRAGRAYIRVFEKKYLMQIPLYNLVHETVYQFAGLKKLPFSEVVMVSPFGTGTLMTGFITDKVDEDLYTVFVPTAPNPTNGNIYHVKTENITFLNANTQEAMRSIVGMGTGTAKLMAKAKAHKNNAEKQPTPQSEL